MQKQPDKNTSKTGAFLEHSSKQPSTNLKSNPNNPPTKLSPPAPKTDNVSTNKSTKK